MTDSASIAFKRLLKEKAIAIRDPITWSGVSFDNVDHVITCGDYGFAIALAESYIKNRLQECQ